MRQELSPRELEIVRLVAQGKTNKEIALEMTVAPSTVKDYLANACHKVGVTNRTALTAWWVRQAAAE